MAEVKTGNGIPSPLKKPPSFCHPSSSYKHIYDDIFASPHQSRQQSSTFIDDDYAEMFGSSRTSNGTWSISYSSIPVLDLPPPSEMRVCGASGVTTVSGERGGKVDYGGVFGGFGDGKFNLPDGEELFHQFNKKNEASSNAIPRSQVQTKKATRPEISRQSLNDRSPSNIFSQSVDSFQNSEQKKNEALMKTSGEIRNTAQVHEIPGAIDKMEEAVPVEIALLRKQPVIKDDTQRSKDVNLTKQQGKHDRYISMDLSPIAQNNNSGFLKESGFSASSSVHISQDTSQSATTPTKVFSESIDSLEDFEQKQNEVTMKKSGEIRNTAHVRDLPGAIHKMQEAVPVQTTLSGKLPVIKDDTQQSKDVNITKRHGKHDRYISMDLSPIVQNNNSGFLKDPVYNASSSVDTSHDTSQSGTTSTKAFSQPSEGSSNSFSQPSDGMKHFDHMNHEMHNTDTSEPISGADVHAIHESTSTPHEIDLVHMSSEMSVVKDNTETQKDVDMAEKQGRQSRNFRSELKTSKHNNELDAVFQKEERKPFSLDASLDTRQPSLEAGMSNKVDDNIAINFDIRRKKGRHSRITSLDLGAHKQSFEQDGKLHRKPRFGGSYSFDASNDPQAASVKMQPSMMAPSSSVPQFFPVESHYKISENSIWRNIGTRVYRGGSVSPPSLDEQLDMNSNAARSAAALQRAIEEASMIIQMAKEYLEREGQGSSEVRFKDTLKVIVAKDRQLEDEMDKFEERVSVLEDPVYEKPEKVLKDLPVVQNQKKFVKDEGCMEETIVHDNSPPAAFGEKRFSLPERISIVENPAKSLKGDHIFQDGKKFFEDEGRIEERNADMSRMSDERDTQEGGGEWEAAKSLNQLICGVKNKIASFMAWQTDIEKKEDPKETPDLLGVENSEITTAENNVDDPGCPGQHVEIEIGFLSETVDSCEDESLWSNTAGQEKADSNVDLSPVVAAAPSENFMFFPFRNEAAHIPTDRTEEEKTDFVKSTDIEFMNAREEVLNGPTDTNEEKHTGSMECTDIELMDVREEVLNEPTATDEGNTGSLECTDIEFTNVREEVLDGATDTCEEKDTGAMVECTDIEFKNVREEVLNEVKYEQLNGKSEEQNHEVLDNTCSDRDSADSNNEETAEVMESSSMVGNDRNEPTDDENLKSSHDKECRQDLIPDSHCPESTTEGIDEYGNSKVYEVTKETENWQHDAQILEEIVLGATEGTHDYQEIERDESEANHIEKAAVQMHGCEAIHGYQAIEKGERQANHIEEAAVQMHGFDEYMTADTVTVCKGIIEKVAEKASLTGKDFYEETGSSFIDEITEEMAKEASTVTTNEDEHSQPENEYREEKTEQVTENEHIEDKSEQVFESASLNEAEESCKNDDTSARVEEAASSDEGCDGKMENLNPSLEPNLRTEETMLFYDSFVDLDGITDDDEGDDDDEALPAENYDVYSVKKETFVNDMEVESQDILENQTKPMHDFKEIVNVTEVNSISGSEAEKYGGDAVQRRRRWFDNGAAERPSILEGDITEMEINQEALDESILAGSVEIHAHELNSHKQEVTYSKDTGPTVNHDSGNVNCESTPKRRRWSVKIGDEGLPVPPPLFQDINVNLDEPQNTVHETLLHSKSESSLDNLNAKSDGSLNGIEGDVAVNGIKDKSVEAPPRRRRWFGSGENVGLFSQLGNSEDSGIALGIDQKSKGKDMETGLETGKMEPVNDIHLDEVKRKEKEKEKERIAVERAIREARERAFVEARERARRDASERPNVEARPKVATGAQERVGKVHAEARGPSDKAAVDARLRNERAAVERATQEARERALQKALSEKASHRSREQKFTSSDPNFQSSSSSSRADSSNKSEKYDRFDNESAQRRKVRLEKQSQTIERPVIVLDEKNQRDLLVQKEEAAKKMMADSLDAEVKRWSAGKEGNLRIMLSTLQYILGPESGWQPVSLTDLIASTAVRKAYKKATLCVHPDKLQQRGASIQQKYICDKVFDLLKDAWSKLTPDER